MDGEELVLCSEVDAVGSDSSEEVVPEENVVPLPVAAPPPLYSPVRGQVAVRGRSGRSFRPYRFPYTERVDRRLARKDLLGEAADSERQRLKRKWGGEDLARHVRAQVVKLDDQLESDSSGSGSSPGSRRGPSPTGCTEGFSDVENYEENVYKMTNSLAVFYALKIVEKLKFSCNFLVSAFHKLRKF